MQRLRWSAPVLALAAVLIGAASPSPSPSPSPSGSNRFPPGTHALLHCPQIGAGAFTTVAVGAAPDAQPASPSPAPTGFVLPHFIDAPGTLVLREGTLDPGFSRWLAQTPPRREDCALDIDDGSGRFATRYRVVAASPVTIVIDAAGAPGRVSELILRYDGIKLQLS
jgi:hypothetical protein